MLAFHNEHIASCAFLTYFTPESTTTAANSPTMPQAAVLNDKSALTGIATLMRILVAYNNKSNSYHCSNRHFSPSLRASHKINDKNKHNRRLQPYVLDLTRLRLLQLQKQPHLQQQLQKQQKFNTNTNAALSPMQLSAIQQQQQQQRQLLRIMQLQQCGNL
ncbi:bromodomain-containing protein DDB_G0280777-like [Eurosta solidaginis]|uniref:bromodomain-containing protein DDB_G0280777-like n=1 Tax=Eurosta solidaginis TaxID=178769 RepID=UPI003530D07B